MSFTVVGEEAETDSVGGFRVGSDGWFSCPNSSISTECPADPMTTEPMITLREGQNITPARFPSPR